MKKLPKRKGEKQRLEGAVLGHWLQRGKLTFKGRNVPTANQSWRYVGIDLMPARNVDIVVANAYRWNEVNDESQVS